MKTFVVGGAVRDRLLHLPIHDRDFVVVGATPQDMIDQGFEQVGADFPVFLHPETKEEYALARTERKKGTGYHGFEVTFDPTITLEDDLQRRDLTINAMAVLLEDWDEFSLTGDSRLVIDPFNGASHLQFGVLHPVSDAFCEDPVRVLRAARFCARFGFAASRELDGKTKTLLMNGELDNLVPERVWQEMMKAVMEETPENFFTFLARYGCLQSLFGDLKFRIPFPFGNANLSGLDGHQRIALLLANNVGSQLEANGFLERLKAPRQVQLLVSAVFGTLRLLANKEHLGACKVVDFFESYNLFKRPELAAHTFEAVNRARSVAASEEETEFLRRVLSKSSKIGFSDLTQNQQNTLKGKEVGDAIRDLRIEVVRKELFLWDLKGHDRK